MSGNYSFNIEANNVDFSVPLMDIKVIKIIFEQIEAAAVAKLFAAETETEAVLITAEPSADFVSIIL